MPQSPLRLLRSYIEFVPRSDIKRLPHRLRGIYILYKKLDRGNSYDVVYIGMAGVGRKNGIGGRLRDHDKNKGDSWTHFSAFVVWDNITEEEVRELEGILRHIFRKDSSANKLARQKQYKKSVSLKNCISSK